MPHVVTQSCCSDASCTYACPVNCIAPSPDDPDFLTAEMLHVDPRTCVDCGACVSACPVEAIKPASALTEAEMPFLEINRVYHDRRREEATARHLLARPPARLIVRPRPRPLRVAVVGSGPSGLYAADELLTIPDAQVTIFERLSEPYGLARFGVAPDHRRTRRISSQFEQIRQARGLRFALGVEVGVDVSREELLEHHDAVIYAVGAATDRRLSIPGAELGGVVSATRMVAWYNRHPEAADPGIDLSARRAVIVGNGNVALDVARILTTDPDHLAETDISASALTALRGSRIEEVLVTSRRSPREAAFTLPELLGLASAPGVAVSWEDDVDLSGSKLEWLERLSPALRAGRRRVRLLFGTTPLAFTGIGGRVSGVALRRRDGGVEAIATPLVLTSIGYRGTPVPGLPFDPARGTVPNLGGRVIDPDSGSVLGGTYVTGWIKRGPTGFLGTNRADSQETVRSLIEDVNGETLASKPHNEVVAPIPVPGRRTTT